MKVLNIVSILLIPCLHLIAQDHGHLNAGALGTSQNDPLYFANGNDFIDTSGYVKTLTFTNGGRFAGYYQGNITLTALPTTAEHGGPDANASAPGSFLQFRMRCLSGPKGGAFGFWDAGTTSPTESVMPGETSTNMFALTESDGSPGSDPFGHIHGRRFTATKPGIYKIAFKVWDTSTNGVGGGPIHTPSEFLPVYFQADINITHIAKTNLVTSVRYGSTANQIFTLEYTTNLASPIFWLPAAGPTIGSDYFQTFEDPASIDNTRFYRIKADQLIE
jgi:hypothetical protein